jgi:hypothetical protein
MTIEDNNGQSIELTRGQDEWTLPARAGYPVDEAKLDRILGKLLGLESVYVVSQNAEHHVELEVAADKFQRKVTLDDGSGKRVLLIGGAGSGGYTHLRLDSDPKVYAVDDLKAWELGTRVSDWARRVVLEVEPERIARVEIAKKDKTMILSRANLAEWKLNGEPADANEAKQLVNKIKKIELSDVVGALSDPAIRKKVDQGKDAITVTLSLAQDHLPGTTAVPDAPPPVESPVEPATEGDGQDKTVAKKAVEPVLSERHVLHLAADPDKNNVIYAYLEGGEHVVQLDRWRVAKLLDAEPEKLKVK